MPGGEEGGGEEGGEGEGGKREEMEGSLDGKSEMGVKVKVAVGNKDGESQVCSI